MAINDNLDWAQSYLSQATGIVRTIQQATKLLDNGRRMGAVKNGAKLAIGAIEEAQTFLEKAKKELKKVK